MAPKDKHLTTEIHKDLLTDRAAQEHAADVAVARAMVENGLTRAEAEEIYGVDTKARREL
jgi:hypothetical protein